MSDRLRRAPMLAAVVAATLAAAPPARDGTPAPAFVLEDGAGRDVTLQSFAGKPLVLNVFASWCPPCRQELPGIVAAARRERGRVAFLGVDEQEPVTMAERFVREMAIPYRVAFDHGQFAASYGAASLPETVFVDRSGRISAIVHGPITADALRRNLAAVTVGAR